MKKLLLVVTIVSLFLTSCDSQKAVKFNDKLVIIQNNVILKINTAGSGTADVKKLKEVRDFTKEKVDEIKALEAPSGGEDFKKAMIDDLQFIYDIYDLSIKMEDPKLSDKEVEKLENEFNTMQAKAAMYDNKVLSEQRKFAQKYNFQLKR